MGGSQKNLFRGGGMDIFWNYTMYKLTERLQKGLPASYYICIKLLHFLLLQEQYMYIYM